MGTRGSPGTAVRSQGTACGEAAPVAAYAGDARLWRALRRLTGSRRFAYEIDPVAALDEAARDELWTLYRRHFAAPRASLESSLARGEHVVRIRSRDRGRLCGMMVCSLRPMQHEGRRFAVAWAGAGALDHECRGQWMLERSGLELISRFWWRHPGASIYFLGECCAFRSYRMLARSFDEYWPHPARPTPPWERAVMDELARRAFPTLWDEARRVVRPDRGKHIHASSARSDTAAADPLLRFFTQQNPGADLGEAIILFAPVNLANLTTLFTRKLAGALRRGRR